MVDSTAVKLPWVLRYRGNSGHTCTIVLRENTLETTRLLFKRTSKFWTRLVVLKFLHLFLIFFLKLTFYHDANSIISVDSVYSTNVF